jgi:ABC-type multidrug transport system ATPase subunit
MKSFSADSISISFGMKKVLSGAHLKAACGEIIGLLGANGAGKSTLFKCMLGLHRHSRGSVHIDGAYIPLKERPRKFGYLPQDSFLPRDLAVSRSISLILGKGNLGICGSDARASGLLKKRAWMLSRGELRYVECLLVLSMARPILLLDEPFSQVEPLFREILAEKIRESARGRVIFMTDHLHPDIRRVATCIKVLKEGYVYATDGDQDSLARSGYLPAKDALPG